MRPLELSLSGFRSYRTPASFDWRGRRLVGIVGPIGSGKSSILDAIAFALYGKTPTYERDTKSLINQTATECHVELRFEVDGQIWRSARGLRRKGASGHQLERLASDEAGAPVEESVVGEKPVRARVEQLLGMDFDAFCRSVLLAQNRFSDFLRATPKARNDVLKGVFGYERFDAALEGAKRRVQGAELELASYEREGARLAEARASLAEAEERLGRADDRVRALEGVRATVEAAEERRRDAKDREQAAANRLEQLEGIAASMPAHEDLERATARARSAEEHLAAAATEVERAEAEASTAAAAVEAVARRAGDLAAFGALVQRHDELIRQADAAVRARAAAALALDEAVARQRAATTARDEATKALADSERTVGRTAEDAELAERALHERRHADMARTLRAELAPDEPCPVCGQSVATVPTAGRAPAVAAAEAARERAIQAADAALAAQREASAAVATAEERLAAAGAALEEARAADERALATVEEHDAALDAVKAELLEHLGAGDPHAVLEERSRELRQAREAAEGATADAAAARGALERTRREGDEALAELRRIANRLAGLWGRLGATREVADDAGSVAEAFAAIGESLLAEHERAAAERTVAQEEARTVDGELAGVLGSVGVDADFTAALAAASAERGAASQHVDEVRAAIDAGSDLESRIAAADARHRLAGRLAADLQPSGFLAFVLEEERRALADLGSDHLEELSAYAYRFTDDDRFDVLDMNAAGTQRRADSLSGGETFLASLALALALAEMVARGGGRLDAFFLDEGFGSLDPRHLDRAMEGIGRLVANHPNRLVVLVSHVEQMREMLEDLIVLDKDPITGDTVIVRA